MKKKTKRILIIIFILIVVILAVKTIRENMTPAIGMLEIDGPIMTSLTYLETIKGFEEDEQIKAVIVRLDSPGGRVGPSQEVFEALLRLKQTKPVVASMASISASGAYYIACAADTIYALSGTLTGSIGVILEFIDVSEGLSKLGVSARSITGGELKDAGTPFRPMSDKERRYYEELARDVHDQFIDAVSESRGLPREEVVKYADGRVFTGRQAHAIGLIDNLGGLDDAIEDVKKKAGIEGKPRIIRPKESGGVWKDIKRLVNSYMPIQFGGDSGTLSGGYLRVEYSIQ
ncbi:MAG TPA: signal peptide peptidase SppA [Deltaproteobacteria bacterium]|mgnify:CR=1 FL=1|nr:signal peptide peptidase SppA [Deltaproteobacteria bacterium]